MIELRTPTGQMIRVADERVEHWEARGYLRADQPTKEAAAPKSTAKKAPAKRAAKKPSGKK